VLFEVGAVNQNRRLPVRLREKYSLVMASEVGGTFERVHAVRLRFEKHWRLAIGSGLSTTVSNFHRIESLFLRDTLS